MKTLISGHRIFKLQNYSKEFIKLAISDAIDMIKGFILWKICLIVIEDIIRTGTTKQNKLISKILGG